MMLLKNLVSFVVSFFTARVAKKYAKVAIFSLRALRLNFAYFAVFYPFKHEVHEGSSQRTQRKIQLCVFASLRTV